VAHAAQGGMGALYDLFQDAPVLGSLINPNRIEGDFFRADYGQMAALLRQTLTAETNRTPTVREGTQEGTRQGDDAYELGVVAQGLAEAATLLAGKYHWVVTNVPYLARGKQDAPLRDYCEAAYPAAKQDLATVFLERSLEFCRTGGAASTVLPQNWLFLSSYRTPAREAAQRRDVAVAGAAGAAGNSKHQCGISTFNYSAWATAARTAGQMLCGLDVSAPRAVAEKAAGLIEGEIAQAEQATQLGNPDIRISFEKSGALYLRNSQQRIKASRRATTQQNGDAFGSNPMAADGFHY
jgi:hypothetical protein